MTDPQKVAQALRNVAQWIDEHPDAPAFEASRNSKEEGIVFTGYVDPTPEIELAIGPGEWVADEKYELAKYHVRGEGFVIEFYAGIKKVFDRVEREETKTVTVTEWVRKAAVVLLVLAACHVGYAQKSCHTHELNCDTRGQMAMDYLYSRFGQRDSADDVWLGSAYDTAGRVRLERREHRLEQLEQWAQTLKPEDRDAYLGAISYYEEGAKEAYAEWHSHQKKIEMEAYMKHLKECAQAEREANKKAPLPKPPQSLEGDGR